MSYTARQMLKDIFSDCVAFGYPGYKASPLRRLGKADAYQGFLTYETGDVYEVTVERIKSAKKRRAK